MIVAFAPNGLTLMIGRALLTFLWLYKSMPNLPTTHKDGHRPRLGSVFSLLKELKISLGMLTLCFYGTIHTFYLS